MREYFRPTSVSGTKLLPCALKAVIAAVINMSLLAQQPPDTAPIVFPATTSTYITHCDSIDVLPGPGGSVSLEHGQFILKGGSTIFATENVGFTGCINFMRISFSPAATNVSFQLRSTTSLPDNISITSSGAGTTTYALPGLGSVGITISGTITAISITPQIRNFGFGIAGLVITQPQPNDGLVQFDLPASLPAGSEQSKILLSKAAWDLHFPSTEQLPIANGVPQMRIAGTLLNSVTGTPKSGTVYLKVIDPPDSSAYRGGDATNGDNDQGAGADLAGSGGSGSSISVQADTAGRFQATLRVSSAISGDNFQVVGSTNPAFNCGGQPCPASTTFTLWKRVYVEQEQMFTHGSFIANSVSAGDLSIPVDDPAPFQGLASGTSLQLVHAATTTGASYYSDTVIFRSIASDSSGQWVIQLDPSTPTPRSYGRRPLIPPSPLLDVMRDGVGIPQSGVFVANLAYTAPLLATMFVELKPIAQAVIEVPYVAEFRGAAPVFFASAWLQNGMFGANNALLRDAEPNVFHRLICRHRELAPDPVTHLRGAELGLTTVGSNTNWSFIMAQRVDDLSRAPIYDLATHTRIGTEFTGANATILNGETTAHETIHFWVHAGGVDGTGHCMKQSYNNGNLNCLIHRPYRGRGHDDALVDLHYALHGADSEYMMVRRAANPVPLF